ncbi:MAG: hypothetical protein JWN70_5626 [Planctomycetaceae bacterium]|nr:hypothetical protein [Planctomycetaceae bacterium]
MQVRFLPPQLEHEWKSSGWKQGRPPTDREDEGPSAVVRKRMTIALREPAFGQVRFG